MRLKLIFDLFIDPAAYQRLKDLPGHIRQRIRREISALANQPRPPHAKQLTLPAIETEVWRVRLDKWRIIYTVDNLLNLITVWAIRKRPPYNYQDLAEILKRL